MVSRAAATEGSSMTRNPALPTPTTTDARYRHPMLYRMEFNWTETMRNVAWDTAYMFEFEWQRRTDDELDRQAALFDYYIPTEQGTAFFDMLQEIGYAG
jgi:hypothetical protein